MYSIYSIVYMCMYMYSVYIYSIVMHINNNNIYNNIIT